MPQKKKRFGLGVSFKDLCETNEVSLSQLDALIDSLSYGDLHLVIDELSHSIDSFINKYQTESTYSSLDDLLQNSIQCLDIQPKPNTSKGLFDGLEDLLGH